MILPKGIEERRFRDWNTLLREYMEVWEIALAQGREEWLESQIPICREEEEFRLWLTEMRETLSNHAEVTGYTDADAVDGQPDSRSHEPRCARSGREHLRRP